MLPLNIQFLIHTPGLCVVCTSLIHWYVVGVDQRAKCAIISALCTLPHSPLLYTFLLINKNLFLKVANKLSSNSLVSHNNNKINSALLKLGHCKQACKPMWRYLLTWHPTMFVYNLHGYHLWPDPGLFDHSKLVYIHMECW